MRSLFAFPEIFCVFCMNCSFLSHIFSFSWFARFGRRMIWCCVRPQDNIFGVCSTWAELLLRLCSIQEWCLVACLTWERFWSYVRPEEIFGCLRPEKELVMCATRLKNFCRAGVRPENVFGRNVFDLRKILVVFTLRMLLVVCANWKWEKDLIQQWIKLSEAILSILGDCWEKCIYAPLPKRLMEEFPASKCTYN